jgi:hypothetical protein
MTTNLNQLPNDLPIPQDDGWFDSAPGHQETPKPPSGGFFIFDSSNKPLV